MVGHWLRAEVGCPPHSVRLLISALFVSMGCACSGAPTDRVDAAPAAPPAAAAGTLVASSYGSAADEGASPLRLHRTVLVQGRDGYTFEDNDLRGMLDGAFVWGWNQPGQVHVRVGRRGDSPSFGEFELFRVLYRGDPPPLPRSVEVRTASLELWIESATDVPTAVALYEVLEDWNPGLGGISANNVSPPLPGEVWWVEAAHAQRSWGLPGVGFAADGRDDADTAAMPLATTDFRPGEEKLRFRSDRLARYVERRARENAPLLFLLKIADVDEDSPGRRITLFSSNHGDSRNLTRRPRLTVDWVGFGERDGFSREVLLEFGRSYGVGQWAVAAGDRIAVTFLPGPGSVVDPRIDVSLVRDGVTEAWPGWRFEPVPDGATSAQLNLLAAHDPVPLGQTFDASIHDTWILSGSPETRDVPWFFVSPTGGLHVVRAEYAGAFTWRVAFRPDELGRWRYRWSQSFAEHEYESAPGVFDVVAADLDAVVDALDALSKQVAATLEASSGSSVSDATAQRVRFMRLERAGLALLTPESLRGEPGERLRAAIERLRAAFGESVPQPIPLVEGDPFRWKDESPD